MTDLQESARPVSDRYEIKIIPRDGFGQVNDDWHATVTRLSDGKQLVFISVWRWLLKRRVRRAALDRAFRRVDSHDRKMAEVKEFRA